VLLIKFKSTKQIKEVKDTRYSMEKVSAKAAKEMYEHASKLESEYRHYISGTYPFFFFFLNSDIGRNELEFKCYPICFVLPLLLELRHPFLSKFSFVCLILYFVAAVIPAGVNVAYMCTQIKVAVDQEQKKTLWVPCGSM